MKRQESTKYIVATRQVLDIEFLQKYIPQKTLLFLPKNSVKLCVLRAFAPLREVFWERLLTAKSPFLTLSVDKLKDKLL
jgi:hypothetical protein